MNPWGRDQELEADRLGMMIIHWAGYDISPIPAFWQSMAANNSNEHDFFSTHPADSKRIAVMNELIHEIENERDFYSQPVLSKSPVPKEEFADSHLNVKYCPQCGAKAEKDNKFCSACGARFDEDLKCSKCGALVEPGDTFCINCGNKL